jgi:hypothetical protein
MTFPRKRPDLLPGDQIRPEDPCRWNIDFLFADLHNVAHRQ